MPLFNVTIVMDNGRSLSFTNLTDAGVDVILADAAKGPACRVAFIGCDRPNGTQAHLQLFEGKWQGVENIVVDASRTWRSMVVVGR